MTYLRALALRIAWRYLGTPYLWSGDDPTGFDCSGYVVEVLRSVGVLDRNEDLSAQGLRDRFPMVGEPCAGCLVFWGTPAKATHVELMIDDKRAIGASGGTSSTTTPAEAARVNAYVKVRPIAGRRDLLGFADPFAGTGG